MSIRDDFDPSSESIHGLLSGSSCQKEVSEKDDEPMNDPYTQPSRHTARGSSQQREEPQQDTSAERWWEDHRSSPGSPSSRIDLPPEEVGRDAEEEQQEPYFEAEDHVQEEAAALWVTEDQIADDYLSDQASSSVPATNPWVLYEAGVICSRLEDGSLEHNSSGERILNIRELGYLFTNQRVKLRHRPEWEKLPWTGHLCYLFTRAWEIGRWKSHHKKMRECNEMRTLSERARQRGFDWMRGQVDPANWERRHEIPMNSWHETWPNYQRDIEIQDDMGWLSEAVYQFYQVHLDKMIRKNDKLWVDFCRKRYVWNDATQDYDEFLELRTEGYDTSDPAVVIPSTSKTIIPEPEIHFFLFNCVTTLMVMAIELYIKKSLNDSFASMPPMLIENLSNLWRTGSR